ncbi:MAG: segregation/condensation protein A [Candidatus Woesearchaeota archaeon]
MTVSVSNEDKIFSILFKEDEVTWQTIIHELIREEKMDPWNINVSLLAEKYLKTLEKLKEMDFRLSGKIILAAAFFLKIKSDKLLTEDLAFFDDLINPQEEEFLDILEDINPQSTIGKPELKYKTPQPRKRKVSVYDLINALEKALETGYKRSVKPAVKQSYKIPEKKKDITLVINELYESVRKTLTKIKSIEFSKLVPSMDREDKINTFIPLLYLQNQRRIELEQEHAFAEILIKLGQLREEYIEAAQVSE